MFSRRGVELPLGGGPPKGSRAFQDAFLCLDFSCPKSPSPPLTPGTDWCPSQPRHPRTFHDAPLLSRHHLIDRHFGRVGSSREAAVSTDAVQRLIVTTRLPYQPPELRTRIVWSSIPRTRSRHPQVMGRRGCRAVRSTNPRVIL